MQTRVDACAHYDCTDQRERADYHPLRAPAVMRDLRRRERSADGLRIFQHLDELGRRLWTIDRIDCQTACDQFLETERYILSIRRQWRRRLRQSRGQHLARTEIRERCSARQHLVRGDSQYV